MAIFPSNGTKITPEVGAACLLKNLQVSSKLDKGVEFYGPLSKLPQDFIIARLLFPRGNGEGQRGCLITKQHPNLQRVSTVWPLKNLHVSSELEQVIEFCGPLNKLPPAF